MKICIVGAGAIGGLLGAKLAASGNQVTLIVRGDNLAAIRKDGLRLINYGKNSGDNSGENFGDKSPCFESKSKPSNPHKPNPSEIFDISDISNPSDLVIGPRDITATSDISDAGPQDLVILAMKSHQVAAVAPRLEKLFNKTDDRGDKIDKLSMLEGRTRIVTMQNGIPWWYFKRFKGAVDAPPHSIQTLSGMDLDSVDPGGLVARHIDVDRVIGSVVYPASEIVRPGVIRLIEGNKFSLGELDGSNSSDVREIANVFRHAGFKCPISTDIRSEIWLKLWGNMSFNPISALTRATLEDICLNPLTRELAGAMMREAQLIGEKLGATFKVSLEKRIAGAQAVGQHKTSMLQDIEAQRPLELAALVGAVIEMGRIVQVPTPITSSVYALAKLLETTSRNS